MFCKNCGQEINDNAIICPHCGVQVANIQTPNVQTQDKSNPIALVGFILSFFVCIAGLVCSIIGYKKAKEEGLDNKGLALAGIIISSLEIAFIVLYVIIIVAAVSCFASYPGYYY